MKRMIIVLAVVFLGLPYAVKGPFGAFLLYLWVAYFRPDDTAVFDARYMLEEDDGTLILVNNRGFLWGRTPDVMGRLRKWAFEGGAPVPHAEYYLRANPSFEVSTGKHDWLTRQVFVGVGERKPDGNLVRYYALT